MISLFIWQQKLLKDSRLTNAKRHYWKKKYQRIPKWYVKRTIVASRPKSAQNDYWYHDILPLALPSLTIVVRRSRGATTTTDVDRGVVVVVGRICFTTGVNADATANSEATDNNTFLIMIAYNIDINVYVYLYEERLRCFIEIQTVMALFFFSATSTVDPVWGLWQICSTPTKKKDRLRQHATYVLLSTQLGSTGRDTIFLRTWVNMGSRKDTGTFEKCLFWPEVER